MFHEPWRVLPRPNLLVCPQQHNSSQLPAPSAQSAALPFQLGLSEGHQHQTAAHRSKQTHPLFPNRQTPTMDSLRSVLQPVTHNLPGPIRDLGVSIIGDTCYKALVLDVDLENTECVKLAVSKGLGIGIVGASAVVKVPQILKLVQSRSASGVSFLSYLLETASYLVSLAYNVRNAFPFSTYGETALVLGQNVIITVLVLHYSGRASMAALFVAALATSAVTLFNENLLDMETLGYLQVGAGALGVASKLPQIVAIWQQGGTGQLSAFAVSGKITRGRGHLLPWSVSIRAEVPLTRGWLPAQRNNRSSTTSSAR